MSDWFGLGVIVFLIVLALVAAARLGAPRRRISVEEFEERARTGGHTRAGLFGLQELLNPKAARAVEVQQDLKHGYYNKKRVPGEGDDGDEDAAEEAAAVARATDERMAGGKSVREIGRGVNPTESEERDA